MHQSAAYSYALKYFCSAVRMYLHYFLRIYFLMRATLLMYADGCAFLCVFRLLLPGNAKGRRRRLFCTLKELSYPGCQHSCFHDNITNIRKTAAIEITGRPVGTRQRFRV